MSRIGKAPITVPSGVDVTISGRTVTVKGPKGSLSRDIPGEIVVRKEESTILVERPNDERQNRSLHGLSRTLVNNMVIGVTEGFTKELEIVGVGYRAEAQGANLRLALGFSHPVVVPAPEGISFEIPVQTRVIVKGIDKELVGQVAANIRSIRKPEPYKGKGVRYLNERILRKAGKTGKK
ncbi:MAG: 50S ribosomal protein L6 [actinobacterium acAcidi]|jgi:large subunit ribosomal protein L6|nr:MAG: 50S ribosomal protein L6 [actinobacterium acAcidi]